MFRFRFTRLLIWIGLAAAATYLLDPERGDQRRKGLRRQINQLRQKSKKVGKEISKKANLA
jgi:gas vesicle protein